MYLAFQTEGYRFRAVVVSGEAHGVGSSFVALHAAHHLRERSCFPGGVVWVPPAEGLSLLQRVGRAIGAPASVSEGDVSPMRMRLRGCPRRLLLVLDNVEACSCFVRAIRGYDEGGSSSGSTSAPPVVCSAVCTTSALRELLGASDTIHALIVTTDDATSDVSPRLYPPAPPDPAQGAPPPVMHAPPYAGAGSPAVSAASSLPTYAGCGSEVATPAASPPPPPPPSLLSLRAAGSAPKLSVFEGSESDGGLFFGGGARPRVIRVSRRRHEPRYRGRDDSDSFWTALRLLFERRLRVPAAALKGEVAWLALLDAAARRCPGGIGGAVRPSHSLLEHLDEPSTPRAALAAVLGDTAPSELDTLRGSLMRADPPPALPRALRGASDAAILEQFESSTLTLDLGGSMRAIDAFVLAAAARRLYHLPMHTARLCAAEAAGARSSFLAPPLDAAGQAVAFGLLPSPRGPLSPGAASPTAHALLLSDGPAFHSGAQAPAAPAAAPPAPAGGSAPYLGAVPVADPPVRQLAPPPPPLRAEDLVAITARAPDAEDALAPAVLARRSGVFVLRGSASKGPGAVAITYTLLRAGAPAAAPPEVLHALVLPAPGGAGGVVVPPSTTPFASLAAVVEAYAYLSEAVIPGTGRAVPRADVLRLLRGHPVYGGAPSPAPLHYTGSW